MFCAIDVGHCLMATFDMGQRAYSSYVVFLLTLRDDPARLSLVGYVMVCLPLLGTEKEIMMTKLINLIALSLFAVASFAGNTPAPPDAKLYFVSPHDGSEVKSPVTVRFGLSGMGVAPAGVEKEKTGHHHLIVDADLPDVNTPIPSDANYRHFGGGQTEVLLELAPGQHTLQLLLGDFTHIPHNPPITSDKITITVK